MKITFSKKGKSDITEVITALSIQKKDTYMQSLIRKILGLNLPRHQS